MKFRSSILCHLFAVLCLLFLPARAQVSIAWDEIDAPEILSIYTGITPAADRLLYFTSPTTGALATFTPFARTLLDDADAPTARATLGLIIGTDVLAPNGSGASLTALNGSAISSGTISASRLPVAAESDLASAKNFAMWGDSLTASGWPATFGAIAGYSTYNGGAGGENSTQIRSRMVADSVRRPYNVVIWAGRNNYTDPVTVKADIAAMVASLGHTRYLVMGVINGNYPPGENVGGSGYNTIVGLNADLATLYGTRFIDIRSYLISSGLADAGITPTSQDLTDIANDIVPLSLRADNVHLNTAGNALVAAKVAASLAPIYPAAERVVSPNAFPYFFSAPPTIGGGTRGPIYASSLGVNTGAPSSGVTAEINGTVRITGSQTLQLGSTRAVNISGDGSSFQFNGSVVPATDGGGNLGYSSGFLRWANLYLTGGVNAATLTLSGNSTFNAQNFFNAPVGLPLQQWRAGTGTQAGGLVQIANSAGVEKWRLGLRDMLSGGETDDLWLGYWDGATRYNSFRFSNSGLTVRGTIIAGSGSTTITDAGGKILSAALNTVARAQGGTGSTTGAMSVSSAATNGIDLYNTVDEATNLERLRLFWSGNVARLQQQAAGSGTVRNLEIGNGGAAASTTILGGFTSFSVTNGATNIVASRTLSNSGNVLFGISPTLTNGSGTNVSLDITPTLNQTATGAATDLRINRTETAIGSGAQLLIDAQVGGVSKFSVDRAGFVTTPAGVLGAKPLTETATLDFGSIAAAASEDLTITVSGAVVGYSTTHGLPAAPAAGITWDSFVSAADTVTIRATNITASAVDPASATYRATVFVP